MRTNVNLSIPGTHARLGDLVTDVVTGFTGIATSYCRHLTGCDKVGVQSQVHGEEQKKDFYWSDVMCVEVVEANVVKASPMPTEIPAAG